MGDDPLCVHGPWVCPHPRRREKCVVILRLAEPEAEG